MDPWFWELIFISLFYEFCSSADFIRQFNCLIMAMIHHQSPTSRFNKRMTHQMTHKWFLMFFFGRLKKFKNFSSSNSFLFDSRKRNSNSPISIWIWSASAHDQRTEDWWRHQLNATVNLPRSLAAAYRGKIGHSLGNTGKEALIISGKRKRIQKRKWIQNSWEEDFNNSKEILEIRQS